MDKIRKVISDLRVGSHKTTTQTFTSSIQQKEKQKRRIGYYIRKHTLFTRTREEYIEEKHKRERLAKMPDKPSANPQPEWLNRRLSEVSVDSTLPCTSRYAGLLDEVKDQVIGNDSAYTDVISGKTAVPNADIDSIRLMYVDPRNGNPLVMDVGQRRRQGIITNPHPVLGSPINVAFDNRILERQHARHEYIVKRDIANDCDIPMEDVSCQAEEKQYERELLNGFCKRDVARTYAKKTRRTVHAKLLNFLRCKHFMHVRNISFITTLVADARAWMLSNKHLMDNDMDYTILSMAVMEAFYISSEESKFRAILKRRDVMDSLLHHNMLLEGNLGYRFFLKNGTNLEKILKRPFLAKAGTLPSKVMV